MAGRRIYSQLFVRYQQQSGLDFYYWAFVVIFIISNSIQQRLRADDFQIPPHRQAVSVIYNCKKYIFRLVGFSNSALVHFSTSVSEQHWFGSVFAFSIFSKVQLLQKTSALGAALLLYYYGADSSVRSNIGNNIELHLCFDEIWFVAKTARRLYCNIQLRQVHLYIGRRRLL